LKLYVDQPICYYPRSCNIKHCMNVFRTFLRFYRFTIELQVFYDKVVEIIVVGNRQLSKYL